MEFATLIVKLKEYPKIESEITCGLCTNNKVLKPSSDSKLENRLFVFQEPHLRLLAPSIGEFPNAFWNLNDSVLICPLCAYLIIHHHIPFENARTQNGQIFVNAPSFKIMWYLNKFASEVLSKRRDYQLREVLGISFIEFAQKVFTMLGAWSMMNIEMVIKNKDSIEYYSLPYDVSKVLLNKEVASLISQTNEEFILEIILDGKFDELLTVNQKILRYGITNSSAYEDKYLSKHRKKDAYSLRKLSTILPELYVKVDNILKRGGL